MSVAVASWGRELSSRGLSGSLFATVARQRLEAARALHDQGLGIHVDLIVRADGTHRGVSLDEARRVRASLPDATMDVHLIVEGDPAGAVAEQAVDDAVILATALRAERLTVSSGLLRAHRGRLQSARAAGLAVWCELTPGGEIGPADGSDGRLVMLIRPGSVDAADPAALDAVRALAGRVPVGVDGGVTEDLARASADLGAQPIVSGRALLVPADIITTQREGSTHVHHHP